MQFQKEIMKLELTLKKNEKPLMKYRIVRVQYLLYLPDLASKGTSGGVMVSKVD